MEPGRRIRGAIELDNYGSYFTGAARLSGQLDAYGPLRLGDWFSLRATKGDPGLEYAHATYELPLGGDGFRLGAAYSHVDYRLGKSFSGGFVLIAEDRKRYITASYTAYSFDTAK